MAEEQESASSEQSAAALASLRVEVLGPLRVIVDGDAVPISRMQVRQVLGQLVGTHGHVAYDRLIDELWEHDLPVNPKRALQVVLSRVRSTLGAAADHLNTTPSGVALDIAATDVRDFDHHLEVATNPQLDHDVRQRAFGEAFALWRGEAFADARGGPGVQRLADDLAERRRAAAVALAELLTATGQHSRAVEVAGPWFDENPHDERLAVVLARSLAGVGRRSDAVATFDRARTALRDTLGVGLSDRSRAVEREVLEDSIDVGTTFTPQPDSAILVGRALELEQLTRAVLAGRSVVVAGEPGIGRTALLNRLGQRLLEHGRVPVSATAHRHDAPLESVASIVRQLVDQSANVPPDALHAEALRRIAPDHPAATPGPPIGSRQELMRAVSSMIVAHAHTEANAVVLVDDVHLLDPMSADVLSQSIIDGVTVIGTARAELGRVDPLSQRTAVDTVELVGLRSAEVRALVGTRYGSQPTPDVEELVRHSGGNPSFIGLLIDLDLDGAFVDGGLPTSLLVAVQERLAGLSSSVIGTLQVASLLGKQFELDAIRQLCETADRDLEDAVASRLIRLDESATTASFEHGLVADAILELLPPGRTIDHHYEIARVLDAMGASPVRVARHAAASADLDPVGAVVGQRDAGMHLLRSHSLDEATQHFERGLAIVALHRLEGTPAHVESLIALGQVQRLDAQPTHIDTSLQAAALARETSPDLLGKAVIELASHGAATLAGHRDVELVALIDEALDADLSAPIRAEVMAAATSVFALTSDYRRGQELFERADHMAINIDDPGLSGRVLAHAHLGYSRPDQVAVRIDARRRLDRVAGDDVDLAWEAAYLGFWEGFLEARRDVMERHIETMTTLTPRARHRHASLLHTRTAHEHAIGNLDEAERLLNESMVTARGVLSESMAFAHHGSILMAIRSSQGRVHELEHAAQTLASQMPEYTNLRAAEALVLSECGRLDEAQRLLEQLSAHGFDELLFDLSWTASVWGLGRVAARCDRRDLGNDLYDLLRPHQGRMSWAGTCTFGPNDTVLAELATLLGRDADALRHREVAATMIDGLRDA